MSKTMEFLDIGEIFRDAERTTIMYIIMSKCRQLIIVYGFISEELGDMINFISSK